MTDTETESGGVEPPEGETFSDENDVEQAVEQANQFHQMMDGAKVWSRETATDLRVKAALEGDDELNQIAGLVESVQTRIEQGDNNRARQP
jgi:hypothetical protein